MNHAIIKETHLWEICLEAYYGPLLFVIKIIISAFVHKQGAHARTLLATYDYRHKHLSSLLELIIYPMRYSSVPKSVKGDNSYTHGTNWKHSQNYEISEVHAPRILINKLRNIYSIAILQSTL